MPTVRAHIFFLTVVDAVVVVVVALELDDPRKRICAMTLHMLCPIDISSQKAK